MRANEKGTCQYFFQNGHFVEYYSLSVDTWTCIKMAHFPLKSSLLGFVIVLQIVWECHVIDAGLVTTAPFWWWDLELLMLTRHPLIPSVASVRCSHVQSWVFEKISCKIYSSQLWVCVFGINNQKVMSHFYLHHEGQANRGFNEICSLLLEYITNHVSDIVKELIFFFRQQSWPKQKPYLVSDSLQR
jgi:hypothetical protein